MRILLAGGGSGGHVTPLRAISQSLQKKYPEVELSVITDRKFYMQTKFLFQNQSLVALHRIYSGKLRRYSSKSMVWHIYHLPTLAQNVRDVLYLIIGTIQATIYFIRKKPDSVFCKGGYVCVPIGIAAWLFRVPITIHDSDTHPGLTNQILARWATTIATGMPAKYYTYPQSKLRYTGIPVNAEFRPVDIANQKTMKQKLVFKPEQPVVLITGGGTGAAELNSAVTQVAELLLSEGWGIVQITGKGKAKNALEVRETLPSELQANWQIEEFTELLHFVQAADVVVSRAGATAMQEFANAKKPVIVVPSPHLSGDHQSKNAAMFVEHEAALVLQETELQHDPNLLFRKITELYTNKKLQKKLQGSLHKHFAKYNAANELAEIIHDAASSS